MKSKKLLGLLTAGAVVAAGMSASSFASHHKGGAGHGENREAVKAAVEANDYSALTAEQQEKISQERFDEMVTRHDAMAVHKSAIEEAVKNNDYDAFVAAQEERKASMEANRSEDAPEKAEREEKTEEEKKAHFDEMVAYYSENGELPEKKMKKGKKGGEKKGMFKKGSRNFGQKFTAFSSYESFQEKFKNRPIAEKINEDTFVLIQDLIQAFLDNDEDTINSLKGQIRSALKS